MGSSPSHTAPAAEIRTIKLWINAFIPHDIEGAQPITSGPHAGKTLLGSGPINACFLTDGRSFSTDPHAYARMHSEIEIDAAEGRVRGEHHRCDETIQVDCASGEELCRETPDTSGMGFDAFTLSADHRVFSVDVKASARNACLKVVAVQVSPNLDYRGTITVTLRDGRQRAEIAFEGKIELYPAFEMYVSVNGGAPQTVFREAAVPGSTPANLVGPPARDVAHRIEVEGG